MYLVISSYSDFSFFVASFRICTNMFLYNL